MARSADDILEQLYRWLPEDLQGEEGSRLYAVWRGMAAVLARVEESGLELVGQASIGEGEGIWLRLHGEGLGVLATADESDPQLRTRIRNIEDKVDRPAILRIVNAILATVTDLEAGMIERQDNRSWVVGRDPVGAAPLCWVWNHFFLCLPLLPAAELPAVVGAWAVGRDWIGLSKENTVYPVIRAEVDRSRAAGIRVTYTYYIGA